MLISRRPLDYRLSSCVSETLQRGVPLFCAILLAVLALLVTSAAHSQTRYEDPAGRYALTVPKGWRVANANLQALMIAARDASVTVTFAQQGDAESVAQAIVAQVAQQWQQFQELKRGPAMLGEQRGVFVLCSGKNPKGEAGYFRVAAAPFGAGVLVMMTSAPQQRFAELKGGLEALERSVTQLDADAKSESAAEAAPAEQETRLAALEKAYEDGVLSREAFEAKRRALAQNGKDAAAPVKQTKSGQPSAGKNTKYYRMRYATAMDNEGWGEPVEAFRMLIPADWKSEGGMRWVSNLGCPANIIQVQFRASAPDGVTGIEILPAYTWVAAEDPQMQQTQQQQAQAQQGCNVGPMVGAADFLRGMVVPQMRRGAQVLAAQRLDGATQALQQSLQAINQQYAAAGLPSQIIGEAGRVRVAYRMGQREVEEWISASVIANVQSMMSTAGALQGNMNATARSFQFTGQDVMVSRAPRGQLEANGELFSLMFGSIQVNPQYLAARNQFLANIARINMQGAQDRHRIWREAQAHIENSRAETYQYQQQVQDRINEQFGQTIRGVETYIDARSNERLELSANFNQAWRHPNGDVLLSNSPNFDPRVELREDWRELRKEHPR